MPCGFYKDEFDEQNEITTVRWRYIKSVEVATNFNKSERT